MVIVSKQCCWTNNVRSTLFVQQHCWTKHVDIILVSKLSCLSLFYDSLLEISDFLHPRCVMYVVSVYIHFPILPGRDVKSLYYQANNAVTNIVLMAEQLCWMTTLFTPVDNLQQVVCCCICTYGEYFLVMQQSRIWRMYNCINLVSLTTHTYSYTVL